MLQVIALSFPFCPQMQLLAFVLAKFGLLSRKAFCFNSEHRFLDFPGEILSEAKEEEISPRNPWVCLPEVLHLHSDSPFEICM